jgi:hypothetical protein
LFQVYPELKLNSMALSNPFTPTINYWSASGQAVSTPAFADLIKAFVSSEVVLLIHGYNNNQQEASDAYNNFVTHLKGTDRTVTANLIGVYWPGSNWEGALYYMQALGQVKKVAPVLANGLYQIGKAKNYLKVNIVTHSLGGRLALETIKQILALKQADPNPPALVIGKISMMAAAVPVAYLEDSTELQATLPAFNATQSLFSLQDVVLHWAFPAGQTAAGQGFFPVALGRKRWSGGGQLIPQMAQVEDRGANHGDYWGMASRSKATETVAAEAIYNFQAIGPSVSRIITVRSVASAPDAAARTTADARVIPVRGLN